MSAFRLSYAAAALALAGALGLAASCKSTTSPSCGSGTPPSVVGTYSLQSYTIGITTLTPPQASGTLKFAASTYLANLTIIGQPVVDSGTYAITGASCISQSSVVPGNPQFTGTFSLVGTTLSVSGVAGGQAAASVWTKTS